MLEQGTTRPLTVHVVGAVTGVVTGAVLGGVLGQVMTAPVTERQTAGGVVGVVGVVGGGAAGVVPGVVGTGVVGVVTGVVPGVVGTGVVTGVVSGVVSVGVVGVVTGVAPGVVGAVVGFVLTGVTTDTANRSNILPAVTAAKVQPLEPRCSKTVARPDASLGVKAGSNRQRFSQLVWTTARSGPAWTWVLNRFTRICLHSLLPSVMLSSSCW